MKSAYHYNVQYWLKRMVIEFGEKFEEEYLAGAVDGITTHEDVLADAFKQNPEMLPASRVKVSYHQV